MNETLIEQLPKEGWYGPDSTGRLTFITHNTSIAFRAPTKQGWTNTWIARYKDYVRFVYRQP